MQERVLITGGHGFVGGLLTTWLSNTHPDWALMVTGRRGGVVLDVTDPVQVLDVVRSARPTMVAHLAAISTLENSEADQRKTWAVNFEGAFNLMEAVERAAPQARLLFISSAQVYGDSLKTGVPVSEAEPLRPTNSYAAAKASAELMLYQKGAAGRSVVIARPFNHTGATQSTAFAIPKFAAQIARIERGLAEPELWVGNLDDERDFLDGRDIVAAYGLLLERKDIPTATTYNVCSGARRRMGDVIESMLGLSSKAIRVRVDPALVRPGPPSAIIGDPARLHSLGWKPAISFQDTLLSVLEAQRRALA